MPTAIPIAIALTANYALPAAVMLKSVLDASIDRFMVYCLVPEALPPDVVEGWKSMAGGHMDVRCLVMSDALKECYIDPRYTEAASFRLLLPELLPEVDKILYLDCDILVRQDMGRFYRETDLGDNYLAAVYEAPIPGQAARIEKLGLSAESYFNSGMLLMNLSVMRQEKVAEKLLDACKVDYLEFPDQDALNQVCEGRVLPVSPLYNGIRTFFLPQYRHEFERQYPEVSWKELQGAANIHYTGEKPWRGYTVKFGEWWRVYYALPASMRQWFACPSKIRTLSVLYKSRIIEGLLEGARNLRRLFINRK